MNIFYVEDIEGDVVAFRKKMNGMSVVIIDKPFNEGELYFKEYRKSENGLKIDIILLDMINKDPEATVFGIQVLDAIRGNSSLDGVPVCLFSNQIIDRRDFSVGAPKVKMSGDNYLTFKGFDGGELIYVFQAIVAGRVPK